MRKSRLRSIDYQLDKELSAPGDTAIKNYSRMRMQLFDEVWSPSGHCAGSGAMVFVICILLCIAATWVEVNAAENSNSPDATATQLAADIAGKIQSASTHLVNISKRDEIRQLYTAGDQQVLNAQADTLAREMEGVLKLRMLLPGQYDVEPDAQPPMGYASMELLRKAEKSSNPPAAELHAHGGPASHIVVVQRVENEDKTLIGLLHLSLAPDVYLQMNSVPGYAELSQAAGKDFLVLSKTGKKEFQKGTPVSANINGTRWTISYWQGGAPESGSLSSAANADMEILPLTPVFTAFVIVVLTTTGYLFYRRKKIKDGEEGSITAETGNDVVYTGAVKAIIEGKHPGLVKLIPILTNMKVVKPVQESDEDITLAPVVTITPTLVPAGNKPARSAGEHKQQMPTMKTPPSVAITAPAAATVNNLAATVPLPEKPVMAPTESPGTVPAPAQAEAVPAIIFRAYDIRGIVGKTLTVKGVYEIARAIGSEAEARGQKTIAVGRDGRLSGPELAESLIKGLQATGRDVIDIGMVPTPVLYFATHHLQTGSGVMLTGSHNGPVYNGLKTMLGGDTLSGDAIQALRNRIETGAIISGQGTVKTVDVTAAYLQRATEDMPALPGNTFKLVVDCGNGIAGMIAPQLYRALGHDVVELFCNVDGTFPNHHPDPSQPENLQALIAKVRELQADLGLAFDGDGDRLGVIDSSGNVIWPDRQLMLFAQDVLSRNAGAPIIYDVKCSRHMKSIIEKSGGQPVMWKTGHSFIKAKLKEMGSPLAGEMSGHIFFKERWFGFDDALYAGVRLLEILGKNKAKSADVFAELPGGVATPELRIMLPESQHSKFMQDLRATIDFKDVEISDIDGVRVEFRNGWGLVRPSNTTPCLTARFEADDDQALEQIQASFRALIKTVAPELKLPF